MKTAVLVLNWNRSDLTIKCIDSLGRQTFADFDLYVMDNGSSDAEKSMLKSYLDGIEHTQSRWYDENLGFTAAHNKMFAELLSKDHDYEFICLLNNDAEADPQWLESLHHCALETGAGMVASRMLLYNDRFRIDNAGHILLNTGEILPRLHGKGKDSAKFRQSVFGACGGACLYRADMMKDIGLFDDYFHTGYEDAEYGIRAIVAGYDCIYEPSAVVYHHVSASIDTIKDRKYLIRIQTNIFYSYLKLMPTSVVILNLPCFLFKYFCILIIDILLGRWSFLLIQWNALKKLTGADRQILIQGRQASRHLRNRRRPIDILNRMSFFLWVDVKRLYLLIFKKRSSYFDS